MLDTRNWRAHVLPLPTTHASPHKSPQVHTSPRKSLNHALKIKPTLSREHSYSHEQPCPAPVPFLQKQLPDFSLPLRRHVNLPLCFDEVIDRANALKTGLGPSVWSKTCQEERGWQGRSVQEVSGSTHTFKSRQTFPLEGTRRAESAWNGESRALSTSPTLEVSGSSRRSLSSCQVCSNLQQ